MGLCVSNMVHWVPNGVKLELVYNFFIFCSIAEISWAKVHYPTALLFVQEVYF